MPENKNYIFKVLQNNNKKYGSVRVRPTTRYSIYRDKLRIVDIPDHFPPVTQVAIGESIVEAWIKAKIIPIIKY